MVRKFLMVLAAFALGACQSHPVSREERAAVTASLRQFQKALNKRSFPALAPVLARDFHFKGLPPSMSVDGLKTSLPSLTMQMKAVQILSLRREAEGLAVRVGLYFSRGAAELAMEFTPDGKIRSISGDLPRRMPSFAVPEVVSGRFIECGGLMFVRVKVDGRAGFFLIDSGSSEMLLNAKYFSSGTQDEVFPISAGIHGVKPPLGRITVRAFQWENWKMSGVEAAVRDLSHLEHAENTPLLGAIGHAQLKDAALVVEWPQRRIQVFAIRKNGVRKVPDREPPKARVSFTYDLHLPAIPARIGARSFTLLFDSGASGNLLPDLEGLRGHFQQMGTQSDLSDGGLRRQINAPFGKIDEIRLGEVALLDLPVMIYAIPYLDGRGLLGAPLLAQGKVEINFRSQRVSFWEANPGPASSR